MLAFAFLSLAHATTWRVDPSGCADATTIGEGMGLVSDGDTLSIAAGTYDVPQLGITGTNIVIEGDGWDRTIFDGSAVTGDASGIGIWGENITFKNISFRNYGGYGAVDVEQDGATFQGCAFIGNTSGTETWDGASHISFLDTLFADNGAAIRMDQYVAVGTLDIEDSLFIDNEAGLDMDGWFNAVTFDLVSIVNNTFVGDGTSITMSGGYGEGTDDADYKIYIVNNLFAGSEYRWDISADEYGATGEIRNNVYAPETGTWGETYATVSETDNLEGEPAFAAWSDDGDWTNDDLHLVAGSPGIDAGVDGYGAVTTDADGRSRSIDGDGDGVALPDAGAYEFDPTEGDTGGATDTGSAADTGGAPAPAAVSCATVGGRGSAAGLVLVALLGLRRRKDRGVQRISTP